MSQWISVPGPTGETFVNLDALAGVIVNEEYDDPFHDQEPPAFCPDCGARTDIDEEDGKPRVLCPASGCATVRVPFDPVKKVPCARLMSTAGVCFHRFWTEDEIAAVKGALAESVALSKRWSSRERALVDLETGDMLPGLETYLGNVKAAVAEKQAEGLEPRDGWPGSGNRLVEIQDGKTDLDDCPDPEDIAYNAQQREERRLQEYADLPNPEPNIRDDLRLPFAR